MPIWSGSYDYMPIWSYDYINTLYWRRGFGGRGQPRPQPDSSPDPAKSPLIPLCHTYLIYGEYAIRPYGPGIMPYAHMVIYIFIYAHRNYNYIYDYEVSHTTLGPKL